MTTRRNFILGLLICIADAHSKFFYPFISVDSSTEIRDGWILMKEDK